MNGNSDETIFSIVEKQYMPAVLDSVRTHATEIATENGRDEANYVDVFRAFEQRFAGGSKISAPQSASIWRENLFLIIVVFMTVIFGFMGLLPYLVGGGTVDPTKFGYKPDVFLDIAKLFAGVVVGGAAGVAASAAAGRRTKG